jgi:two-component system NtrC family sensor kinase
MNSESGAELSGDFEQLGQKYYRDHQRRNLIRLLLTYFAPIAILAVHFNLQYAALQNKGRELHIKSIAENQAKTLDLFLSERLVNLTNLIDSPRFRIPPEAGEMDSYLQTLVLNSDAFVDIGFIDSSGIQAAYAGPFPSLEKKNYGGEKWYIDLKNNKRHFIITDIYLGFR